MIQLHEVLKLERPLIGVDCETTGVSPKTSAICELALEIFRPGKPPQEYRTLVNPMMPIPPAATKIHGITNEMVKDAPTFVQLAPNLLSGMTNVDFVGYNLWFDIRQLAEEFRRAGQTWSYEGARVIDGFRLWQLAEQRTLSHAVERWLKGRDSTLEDREAIDEEGKAHNALWDIKQSTRVVAAQLRACSFLPRDLNQLHELLWPGRYDADGKLTWKHGELCFTFGAHRDIPLRNVPKGYLKWVVQQDFSDKVKQTCRDACNGVFPASPVQVPADEDVA